MTAVSEQVSQKNELVIWVPPVGQLHTLPELLATITLFPSQVTQPEELHLLHGWVQA